MSCTGRRPSPVARTTDLASWQATGQPGEGRAEGGAGVVARRGRAATSSPSPATAQPSSATRPGRPASMPARRMRQVLGRRRHGGGGGGVARPRPSGAVLPRQLLQAPQQAAELEALERWSAGPPSARGRSSIGGTSPRSSSTGRVGADDRQVARLARVVGVLVERLAPLGRLLARRGRGSRRALPYFWSSCDAPFSPIPGHARQVVARVADHARGSRSSAPGRCRSAPARRRGCRAWCR